MARPMPLFHVIANAVLFQCLWFSAVLEGWSLGIYPLLVMVLHFVVVVKSWVTRFACLGLALLGSMMDSLLGSIGVYQFSPDNVMLLHRLPMWLLFMWLGFSMSLPLSLAWLFRSPMLLVLFFTIGGPASYFAGQKLDALKFAHVDLWILACGWLSISLIALSWRAWISLRPELGEM